MDLIVRRAEGNPRTILLRQKEVVQWLFGDLSFLPEIEKKNVTMDTKKLKVLEDAWGRNALKSLRPDLKLEGQWAGKFGEHVCQEILYLTGKNVSVPKKIKNRHPDLETEDAMIEVKTETFFTSGTASEKILGVPIKYSDVPELFSKPVKIILVGGAEKISREKFGIIGDTITHDKQEYIDFFKTKYFEFIGATDLLNSLI